MMEGHNHETKRQADTFLFQEEYPVYLDKGQAIFFVDGDQYCPGGNPGVSGNVPYE